jgi:hypothetical protein
VVRDFLAAVDIFTGAHEFEPRRQFDIVWPYLRAHQSLILSMTANDRL